MLLPCRQAVAFLPDRDPISTSQAAKPYTRVPTPCEAFAVEVGLPFGSGVLCGVLDIPARGVRRDFRSTAKHETLGLDVGSRTLLPRSWPNYSVAILNDAGSRR
jgi:hypothetical protein